MEKRNPPWLRFTPGRALPRWYRFIARLLSHFYYASIDFIDERGHRVLPLDDAIPTILLVSHRNGATDGWVVSPLLPHGQFLASVQLLRSRFLRLLFTGIPVVREKDRIRYGFSRTQAGNPVLHAIAHIKQGGSLVIFPEGTSEWSYAPQPYQPGTVKIIRRLLQEGQRFRVIPVGSFYQAPDRFGSRVELLVGEALVFPAREDKSQEAWETEISECVNNALNQVSVNCASEAAMVDAERYAQRRQLHGESWALAFKRAASGVHAEKQSDKRQRRRNIWACVLQLPFVLALFPVLLCAWWVGRQADGRNTVTFFRLASGFAASLLWLPCLVTLGILFPWLWLLYAAAYLGWRQRSVWGEVKA